MRRLVAACVAGIVLGLALPVQASPATMAWAATDTATVAQLLAARRLIDASQGSAAETRLQDLLPQVEAIYGPASTPVADVLDLLVEAAGVGSQGRLPEVRAWAGRAAAIRDSSGGSPPVMHALTLHRLAIVQKNAGEYAATDSLVTRGLDLLQAAGLGGSPTAAWMLATRADIAAETGRDDRAGAALDQADTIVAQLPAPDLPLELRLLKARAALWRRQWRLDEAIVLQEEVVTVAERLYGPDHALVVAQLNNLGDDLKNAGRLRQAQECLQRALILGESLGDAGAIQVASVLNNLAMVHMGLGEYAAARRDGEKARALVLQAYGPDHPNTVATVNNMGIIAYQIGDWEMARDCFEQVLVADERQFGPDHLYVAGDLINLASIVYYTGDVVEADRLFDRAVATATTAGGPDHPTTGLARANRGEVLAALGRTDEARVDYIEGIALFEAGVGTDNPEVAALRDAYGVMLADLGEDAAAQEQLQLALAIRTTALGEHHPDTALSRRNVANLMVRMGQTDAASVILAGVCADIEAARGPWDPRLAEALADLAAARWRAGQRDSVLEPALRAEAIGREHLRLVARGLPERQALAYAAARPAGLDLAVTAAEFGGCVDDVWAVWDAAVRSRSLVLDEMVARRSAGWLAADSSAVRLGNQLADARERCANLSVRGPGDLEPAVYHEELDSAREAKERAERELARCSAVFRRVDDLADAGLAEVAAALPPGSALVAYLRHRDGDDGERYSAFVLVANGQPPVPVVLGKAPDIDELVGEWRQTVAAGAVPPGPLAAAAEAACRETGARLRTAVWDPVQMVLGEAVRVFVVPDGALHLVNLAALPTDADRYLVEMGPIFHLLSDERDLLRAPAAAAGRGLLALGGPDFDTWESPPAADRLAVAFRGGASPCADFATLRFSPLPGASTEARAVGETWRQSDSAAAAEVLTGAAAAEATFKRDAAGHRVLHLATHGFFLGDDCGAGVARARGEPGTITSATPQPISATLEDPLLLCGLALAGANHRATATAGEDDGVLTAEEIVALDLTGVAWAVLSGCDTGRGTAAAGEGLMGLRRAFQLAGARTVISSLWAVRDEDARAWMEAFYSASFTQHLDTPAAVRQASLRILADRRADGSSGHPLAWAAFVATGGWD